MLSDSIVTILTPAATIDLTTLTRAKEELGVTSSVSDGTIASWIHEVSSQIASACGRTFGLERLQETFDPSGPHHWQHHYQGRSEVLRLSRWPVTEIESITVNGVLLDPSEYMVDYTNGLIFRVTERWRGQTVAIFKAGYELITDLPYDVEAAALRLLHYHQASSGSSGRDPFLRSKTIQDVGQWAYFDRTQMSGKSGGLPSDVADLLQPYMVPNLA